MSDNGKLDAIWLKRMKRGPMDPVNQAKLVAGSGLAGNADQGRKRQVTIIEKEVFEQLKGELSEKIDPSMRRANLMVSGVPLADTRGKILKIGKCRIRIWGETKPCELMDEMYSGLKKALKPNWHGGAFGEVLDNGEIKVGDEVCLETN